MAPSRRRVGRLEIVRIVDSESPDQRLMTAQWETVQKRNDRLAAGLHSRPTSPSVVSVDISAST
ncbi:MAG: hypothetical protein R2755_26040 [Acidimicrobiales bacterium]